MKQHLLVNNTQLKLIILELIVFLTSHLNDSESIKGSFLIALNRNEL